MISKKDKEHIAQFYNHLIVEWDPLEIEDPNGYIILRAGADSLLTRLIKQYEKDMNEQNTFPNYEQDPDNYDEGTYGDEDCDECAAPYHDPELEDVRAFHNKFGFIDSGRVPVMVTKRKLIERLECMQEELDEFKNAIESQDFAEQADALIDLVYFAKGTAVIMGLPWEQLWDDVQRANISKERGITKRGHAFDVIKPEGWKAPNGLQILSYNGYDRRQFESHGRINENLCTDDHRRVYFHNISSSPEVTKLIRFTQTFEPAIVEPVHDMGTEEESK